MKWGQFVWRSVEQARVMLPVAAVGALAAYTWWLVQAMPEAASSAKPEPPATVPDYVLRQARVERFDAQGQRVSLMQGDTMTHHAHGDQLQVNGLHLVTQNPSDQQKGAFIEAWAKQGFYSGEKGVLELVGLARVAATEYTDGAAAVTTFTGEQLRWHLRDQVLSTEHAVLLQGAQGFVRGMRLKHDARTGMSALTGRVTGALLPQR